MERIKCEREECSVESVYRDETAPWKGAGKGVVAEEVDGGVKAEDRYFWLQFSLRLINV